MTAAPTGRLLPVVAAALVLSGCGGSGASPEPSEETASSTATVSPAPTPEGQDASGDLAEFSCAADGMGAWDASGVLVSSARSVGDYSVTVVVTGPGDSSAPGRQRVLLDVAPGTPTPFEIPDVPPVGSGDLTCQVQVVRLP